MTCEIAIKCDKSNRSHGLHRDRGLYMKFSENNQDSSSLHQWVANSYVVLTSILSNYMAGFCSNSYAYICVFLCNITMLVKTAPVYVPRHKLTAFHTQQVTFQSWMRIYILINFTSIKHKKNRYIVCAHVRAHVCATDPLRYRY